MFAIQCFVNFFVLRQPWMQRSAQIITHKTTQIYDDISNIAKELCAQKTTQVHHWIICKQSKESHANTARNHICVSSQSLHARRPCQAKVKSIQNPAFVNHEATRRFLLQNQKSPPGCQTKNETEIENLLITLITARKMASRQVMLVGPKACMWKFSTCWRTCTQFTFFLQLFSG